MTQPGLVPRCAVYVDGVRLADGQPGESDDQPVALDELAVTWGRSNTLNQPAPATCSFRVLDIPGGQRFLEVLHVGARVRVQADATIYPDPDVSTIPALIPGPVVNGTATGSGTASNTLLATSTTGAAMVVTYPPKAYSGNPSAWDTVPRAAQGQAWRLRVDVTMPALVLGWRNYAVQVNPVAFTSPSSASAVVLANTQKLTAPATGDAHFDLTFVPPDGAWLGLQLRIFPVGPRWADLVGAWTAFGSATWNSLDTFVVRNLIMSAPAAGAARSGSVFAGRITDLEAQYDQGIGGTVVGVICQDDTAELGNRYVGAAPYPLESLSTRFGKVVTDSGMTVAYTVDAGAASKQITYQDVDSRPAIELLQALAQSVGGALWAASTVAAGPFLRLEDISSRPAMRKITFVPPAATNLFTKPSFEDGVSTGWSVGGATLTVVQTTSSAAIPGRSGVKAMRSTATTAATLMNLWTTAAIQPAVVVGKQYRISVYTRSGEATSTATAQLFAEFRTAADVNVGGQFSSAAVAHPPANGWIRLELTSPVAPATAAKLMVYLRVPGAGVAVGTRVDWDAIMVTELAAAGDPTLDYFDGDTPDTATETFWWDGAQWASTSGRIGNAVIVPSLPAGAITLDSCSVLLDPVRWQQDTQDDATRVVVTWQEQTTNPAPPPAVKPTSRDETVTDTGLELATGRRRVGVTTQLAVQADAAALANTLLARLQTPGWRISGLTIDLSAETLDPLTLANVMQILDGATRLGLPIMLTNLPEWNPTGSAADVPLYLEGGRFTNGDGYWRLELLVSSAAAQGKSQLRWVDLPTGLPWTGLGSLTWNDLIGVGI